MRGNGRKNAVAATGEGGCVRRALRSPRTRTTSVPPSRAVGGPVPRPAFARLDRSPSARVPDTRPSPTESAGRVPFVRRSTRTRFLSPPPPHHHHRPTLTSPQHRRRSSRARTNRYRGYRRSAGPVFFGRATYPAGRWHDDTASGRGDGSGGGGDCGGGDGDPMKSAGRNQRNIRPAGSGSGAPPMRRLGVDLCDQIGYKGHKYDVRSSSFEGSGKVLPWTG